MTSRAESSAASGFFPRSRPGEPGLALFLNAGDPPLSMLRDIVQMLDELGVDCLELAVPFPDSCTDGPVIRRSAARALRSSVDLAAVLGVLDTVRGELRNLRIALLVDWSHTIKPVSMPEFIARIAGRAADALLVHGLPPRQRPGYYAAAHEHQLPIVTTCYARSGVCVQAEASANATAYLYLVAHYGRSGSRPAAGFGELTPLVHTLRAQTMAPVAVGFGVRDRRDVQALAGIGADAAVIGSAGVERIEHALTNHTDPVHELAEFVRPLRGAGLPKPDVKEETMIVRTIEHVPSIEWGNGLSRRFLLRSDNMGYTITDTTVRAGTKSRLEYRNHLEACYCIEGRGMVIDIDGNSHPIRPGTMYALDQNDAHFLVAAPDADLRLVCVFSPALFGDERHSLDAAEFSHY